MDRDGDGDQNDDEDDDESDDDVQITIGDIKAGPVAPYQPNFNLKRGQGQNAQGTGEKSKV